MTMTREEILENKNQIEVEITEELIQKWTTPVHKREQVNCPVCGDNPPPEKCEHLEKLEKELNFQMMNADIPCSTECEVIQKL